jgi:uncharacterized protein (DUF58 family)
MAEEPLFGPEFARKLERLSWVLRRRAAGGGEGDLTGRRKGGLLEFADHRDYVPGDDPRYIDWNAYLRLERLAVKEFAKEEDVPLLVLLDASASMGAAWPGKFRLARQAAAALGWVSLASGNSVSAVCFREGERTASRDFRGKGALRGWTAFLETAEPSGRTDLARALADAAASGPAAGLAVLVSDLMDEAFEPRHLAAFAARGRETCVLQVLDPVEVSPGFLGGAAVADAETGETLDLDLREEDLAAFRADRERREEAFRRFAESRGIRYVAVRSDTPFEDVVLRILQKARWLGLGASG